MNLHGPSDRMNKTRARQMLFAGVSLVALGLAQPALAQASGIFDPAATAPTFMATKGNGNMLLNAQQLTYDQRTDTVIARGRVEIYYDGRTIEANEVRYNQKKSTVRAIGRVRITEPGGNVAFAQDLEFDKAFRDGFVKSLRLETPDRRRVAAVSATRVDGDKTIFDRGVYTACEPCRNDPSRAPTWQVKAEKITHLQGEKTIEFHNARMEFMGVPILYMPYFWAPDGTVKRKSGFLMPTWGANNITGVSFDMPYFWAPAPNVDVLFSAAPYSNQGVLFKAHFRHGLENGVYSIKIAGIRQGNPGRFNAADPGLAPGNREWRGSFQTDGNFRLTDNWNFGWDVTLLSDNTFMRDYGVAKTGQTDANSSIYLTGIGERSYFDLRTTRYQVFGTNDANRRYPITHPTLDYFKTLERPVMGGEVSWNVNAVSLSREWADYSPRNAVNAASCYDRSGIAGNGPTAANCLLNGLGGTYSRISAELSWRKRIYDSIGQVWEPYASLRADAAAYSWRDAVVQPTSFLQGQVSQAMARITPTLGLTYRYPWVARHDWGTSTIEPIVQVAVRPNESAIGRMPNEDSQNLVFDDSNLFQWNKFSGYDRAEGGGRLNYALQYTARGDNGASLNVLFGQSLHLFGVNSFTYGDPSVVTQQLDTASAGADSGLESRRSDYVGRISYKPDVYNSLSSRMRFDEKTFAVRRAEVAATTLYQDFSAAGFYTFIAPQPVLGYANNRHGVGVAGRYQINDNWAALGGVRYNITQKRMDSVTVGLNYLDDCIQTGLYYTRDYVSATTLSHNFMFRLSLRTLGELNYGYSAERPY